MYGSDYSVISWLQPWHFALPLIAFIFQALASIALSITAELMHITLDTSTVLIGLASWLFVTFSVRKLLIGNVCNYAR